MSTFIIQFYSLTYKVREYVLWLQRYEKDYYNRKKIDLFFNSYLSHI